MSVKKLVILGDSITDCGRARPVGEGLPGALGNGYVNLFDAMAISPPQGSCFQSSPTGTTSRWQSIPMVC